MRIVAFFLLFLFFLFSTRNLLNLDLKQKNLNISRPSTNNEKLIFFLLGDFGFAGNPQTEVANLMEQRCQEHKKVHGIITLGDNIYPSGVKNPNDPLLDKLIKEPYKKPCLKKIPFYPSLGNHDYKGNISAQIEYSQKNPQWQMPHRFYTVTFGDFFKLIVFDSTWKDFCLNPLTCSLDFLLNEIKNNHHHWLFVSSHHPLSSASKKTEDNYTGNDFTSFLIRNLVCTKVDGWLAGHSHHLEQRKLKSCRTAFFISGAGGAHLNHPHLDQEESLFVQSEYGFIELEIEKNKLTSRIFTKKGLVFEKIQEKSL